MQSICLDAQESDANFPDELPGTVDDYPTALNAPLTCSGFRDKKVATENVDIRWDPTEKFRGSQNPLLGQNFNHRTLVFSGTSYCEQNLGGTMFIPAHFSHMEPTSENEGVGGLVYYRGIPDPGPIKSFEFAEGLTWGQPDVDR
jgi:hypothetical protein